VPEFHQACNLTQFSAAEKSTLPRSRPEFEDREDQSAFGNNGHTFNARGSSKISPREFVEDWRRLGDGSDGPHRATPCRFGKLNVTIAFLLHHTLFAIFNSLMSPEISLLVTNYSLFRILGNFEEKHRWLLRFLTARTSN